jgi:hypothetical protein
VTEPEQRQDGANPGTLKWAVRLLAVETVALAALTVFLVYLDITARVTAAQAALSVTGYGVLMTAGFLAVTVGLARRRRWARAPAIVLNLLQVPIGMSILSAGLFWIGAPAVAAGLATAALLLAPATREALGVR